MESVFRLSDLNGSNGFRINGANAEDESGRSVSNAGDFNGDGFADILIAAPSAGPAEGELDGEVSVLFGRADWADATISLSDLTGSNGFRILGADADDRLGRSVASAGDVNGDGLDDIIIGASSADPNGTIRSGAAYVVFGTADWSQATLSVTDLDGSNGFVLFGPDTGDFIGASVSGAGDVNGDGIDDVLIGAPGSDPGQRSDAGSTYVVFGARDWSDPSLSLADLDGLNGFRVDGLNADNRGGNAVSGAGDVNGDGINDILIGASAANPDGLRNAGESYVIFGLQGGREAVLSPTDLDGSNGFRMQGLRAGEALGTSVSGAGDVNGDGIDDIVIGAAEDNLAGPDLTSGAYFVFGREEWPAASVALDGLDGTNGFRVGGANAPIRARSDVSAAGDVNGDGIDDVLIGVPLTDPDGIDFAGQSYVLFGSSDRAAAYLSLADMNSHDGFRLDGTAGHFRSGWSVSGAGDVNGDGVADFLIGSDWDYEVGRAGLGRSYLLFGSAAPVFARFDGLRFDDTASLDVFDAQGGGLRAFANTQMPVSFGMLNGDAGEFATIGEDGFVATHRQVTDFGVFYLDGASGDWMFVPDAEGINAAVTSRSAEIVVTATDPEGAVRSAPFGIEVQGVNDRPTGDLQILGAAWTGEVLLADVSAIRDADGLGAFSYQWLRDGEVIGDATGASYALTPADVGTALSVQVSFTDGGGALETLNSDPTARVASFLSGTDLAEALTGTDQAEKVAGLAGNDTLAGLSGNDTLLGGAGDDSLVGGTGDDVLNGGDPQNLSNADGADAFLGGDGVDWVSYAGSFGSLRVDLMFPQINTFAAMGDTYDGIENLLGSQGPDNMRGTLDANHIMGGRNVDYIFGRQGDDTLEGGVGDDVLFGGLGADLLIGGENRDRAQYSEALERVVVDLLWADTLNQGEAQGDLFDGIEDLAGSEHDDALAGDNGANRLFGRGGRDRLFGRAGDDILNGGGGRDVLSGMAGNDTLRGGDSQDVFVFTQGADVIEDWFLDIIQLDADALGISGLTAAEVVTQLGGRSGADFVLEFDNGHSLTLLGQADILPAHLADFIEIV